MKEEGRGGGSELGSDLDLDPAQSSMENIKNMDLAKLDLDPEDCFRSICSALKPYTNQFSPTFRDQDRTDL